MRILIATDAWHPQVNGVVRTLTTTGARAATGSAPSVELPDARTQFPHLRLPSYPEIRLALPRPARGRAELIDGGRARCDPHRHRGADRAGWRGAIAARRGLPLHHQLPHPLPRIRPRATGPSPSLGLGAAAPFPRRRRAGDGGDAARWPSELRGRGFRNVAAVAARRRSRICLVRAKVPTSALPAPDVPVASAAWRSRRTSRRSCRSTYPAPRSWSATARRARRLERAIRTRCSSARDRARHWPTPTRPPTCSCSRAGPILSASCCSRRWPAACRSRPSR